MAAGAWCLGAMAAAGGDGFCVVARRLVMVVQKFEIQNVHFNG